MNPQERLRYGKHLCSCGQGGCTPLNPPQTISGGQSGSGFMKIPPLPRYSPYRLVGIRRNDRTQSGSPEGKGRAERRPWECLRTLGPSKSTGVTIMLTGGCRPLNLRRRYSPGRVDRDLRRSTHSPLQSLSPFRGAPQWQGIALRCPWERLRVGCCQGVCIPGPLLAISGGQG